MPKKQLDLLFRSKILVAIVVAILLLLGIVLFVQGLVETRPYSNQIADIVREKTGRDIIIKGDIKVSIVPVPTIFLPGVELKSVDDPSIPSLSVEMVEITAVISSLFSDRPEISSVTLHHPVLELERGKDQTIEWDWVNHTLLKPFVNSTDGINWALNIEDGRILYRNNYSERSWVVDGVNIKGSLGERTSLNGHYSFLGHDLKFVLNTQVEKDHKIPMQVKTFADEQNILSIEGNANWETDELNITGRFHSEVQDVREWVASANQPETDEFIGNRTTDLNAQSTSYSFKLSADYQQNGESILLTNATIEGLNSAGTGAIGIIFDQILSVEADTHFSAFDYQPWQTIVLAIFSKESSKINQSWNYEKEHGNLLPKNITLKWNMEADKVYFGQQIWEKATLATTLDKAGVTVHQFNMALPGETSLTMFGIISQAGGKGLRFEGSLETQGKSLRDALTVFDESAKDLPETGFSDFYARANVFVSPEQVRLSDADIKISELQLSGGLVAYFDTNPRIEADVKLQDINFDYFRDAWREQEAQKEQKDFFLRFHDGAKFNWLKKLHTRIDFRVNVDRFTFLERKGDTASFRIFAEEGRVGIYNSRFNYPDNITEASFSVDIQDEKPFLNIVLNTNEMNTAYFAVDSPLSKDSAEIKKLGNDKPERRWPEALIDMNWMEGTNGAFDITIGRLLHEGLVVDNVKVIANLSGNEMKFKSFTFSYWQGRCAVAGSLYGGKVPAVSVSFSLTNVDLQEVLKTLADRDNITGKANINGSVKTAGVNYLSWVSQSEAQLHIAASGVNVTGLNLQGIVDAVVISRTAADVLNNVNLVAFEGSTEMTVGGTVNVKDGVMRTPGITLKSGGITGNMTGEIQLVPWTMNLSTLFQFPTMTSDTTPTIGIQANGPLDKPELQTDTASLEAYVAKRIIGR